MKKFIFLAAITSNLAGDPTPPHAIDFDKLRRQRIQVIDSQRGLELLVTALNAKRDSTQQIAILRGLKKGLEGKKEVTAPAIWNQVSPKLSNSTIKEIRDLTNSLNQVFGDRNSATIALSHLTQDDADPQLRLSSLRALIAINHPELLDHLTKLIEVDFLQLEVIRAYSKIHDPRSPEFLIKRYPSFSPQSQKAVIETLSIRKDYASSLLAALENEDLSKEDIPTHVARSLTMLLGEPFTKVYGEVKKTSSNKQILLERLRNLVTTHNLTSADPSRGREIYQLKCASCHVLYEEGGNIGPELTGSNRHNTEYLLLNIIDPNADIPEAYRYVEVTTNTGQHLSGTIIAEDDQRLTLNAVGQSYTVLKKSITSRKASTFSMMPEGLLTGHSDQEILDLFKYLQTHKQVPLPQK